MSGTTLFRALARDAEPEEDDPIRDRIVDAAYQRMLAFGIRRTTIEDVARAAGIGRPTLYRRFADKDAIVQAVIVRETRRSLRAVVKKIERVEEAEEQVVRGFVLMTRTAGRHPLIRRLIETEPEVIFPYLSVHAGFILELAHARFTPALRLYQRLGHFADVDARYAVETMVRLFLSIVLTPSALVSATDDAQLEALARNVVLPLLESKDGHDRASKKS